MMEKAAFEEFLRTWARLQNSKKKNVRKFIADQAGQFIGNLRDLDILGFVNAKDENQENLHSFACFVRDTYLGKSIHLRAVIEIGNRCRVNCCYCEMRRDNSDVNRYQLSLDKIVEAAKEAKKSGISTIFIQAGEDPELSSLVEDAIRAIKAMELNVVLCLGSLDTALYEAYRKAGADGYILKFETTDGGLHKMVTGRSLSQRLKCIDELTRIGFSVGSGFIYDLPDSSIEKTVDDILFIQEKQFSMCSITPFISEQNTPFETSSNASLENTLNVIALLRIANPCALIPAVSALQQLSNKESVRGEGQLLGLNAGANVLTVNFTPDRERNMYRIYGPERFIVTLGHALGVAKKAALKILSQESNPVGPISIGEEGRAKWFENRYTSEIPHGDSIYGPLNPLLCKFIQKLPTTNCSVLDIGCGDGRAAIPLLLKDATVTGIDTSIKGTERLKERAEYFSRGNNLQIFNQDAFDVNFHNEEKKYSGAVLARLLYYFSRERVKVLLKNIWQSLRPGGFLYVSVEYATRMMIKKGDTITHFHFGSQHNYRPEDIEKFLEDGNLFKITHMDPGDNVTAVQLPLPAGVLPNADSIDCYMRQYHLYEVIAEKVGS